MWTLLTDNPSRCAKCILQMITVGVETTGVVFVNGYVDLAPFKSIKLPKGWSMRAVRSPVPTSDILNWCYNTYSDEVTYGVIFDCETIHSWEWDRKLIIAAGTTRVAHANDHKSNGATLTGCLTIGGDLVRAVGFWSLPGSQASGAYNLWVKIANDFHLQRFLPEVKVDPLPPVNYPPDLEAADGVLLAQWLKDRYPAVIQQLTRYPFLVYNGGSDAKV
jgi:hypothetical protein